MASIEIAVGATSASRMVEAFPFLPGLVVHKAPDTPGQDLYNVTHRVTGLAILTYVPEQHIPVAQRLLGDACWTVMPDQVYESPEYYELIRMVLQVIRGKDVLQHVDHEDRRRVEPGPDWGFFPHVTTPLLCVEECGAGKDAVVQYATLKQLVDHSRKVRKTPALLVGLKGKEDVAIIPFDVFPRGFFREMRVVLKDATLSGSVTVTAQLVDQLIRGHCWKVSFGKEHFMVLSYLQFLRLTKRGLS